MNDDKCDWCGKSLKTCIVKTTYNKIKDTYHEEHLSERPEEVRSCQYIGSDVICMSEAVDEGIMIDLSFSETFEGERTNIQNADYDVFFDMCQDCVDKNQFIKELIRQHDEDKDDELHKCSFCHKQLYEDELTGILGIEPDFIYKEACSDCLEMLWISVFGFGHGCFEGYLHELR